MNDNFGSLSVDFLPEGYGDTPSKVVQPASAPLPAAQTDTGYGKLFDKERREQRREDRETKRYMGEAWWQKLFNVESQHDKDMKAGAAATASGAVAYRDLPSATGKTKDGYRYRQYGDNSIKVLKTPSGRGVNTHYAAGSTAAKNVISEFGPYPSGAVSSAAASVKSAFGLGTSGGWEAGQKAHKGAGIGAGIGAGLGAAAAQLLPALASMLGPQDLSAYDEEVDTTTSSGPNMGLIIGGVMVVGLLGLGLVMMTRGDDDDEE